MEPLTYEGIYDFLHEKILMDVQFYKNEFKNEERILELGCGTGRIMIPLFENGISAEGIDISEKMIKVFKSKLEKVKLPINIYQQDIRAINIGKTFSAVYIPFNTFLYMETLDDQTACFASVAKHLNEKGRLIIDIANPFSILLTRYEGVLYNDLTKVHEERNSIITLSSNYYFYRNHFHWNQIIEEVNSMGISKLYRRLNMKFVIENDIEYLARQHGFTIENIYGSYDKSEVTKTSPNIIFILSKK